MTNVRKVLVGAKVVGVDGRLRVDLDEASCLCERVKHPGLLQRVPDGPCVFDRLTCVS
jgi:hypothetical protein